MNRSGNAKNNTAGFTLVELMVVVAIIGVLGSLAVVSSKTNPEVHKAGSLLAAHIADASREARSTGPVLDTVVEAEAIGTFRSRLVIDTDTGGQYIAVELRLEDDDTSSSNHELSRTYLPRGTVIAGAEVGQARIEPGGTSTSFSSFELECAPTGVCGPITFYLQNTDAEDQRRVVVMPLSSMPTVLAGW